MPQLQWFDATFANVTLPQLIERRSRQFKHREKALTLKLAITWVVWFRWRRLIHASASGRRVGCWRAQRVCAHLRRLWRLGAYITVCRTTSVCDVKFLKQVWHQGHFCFVRCTVNVSFGQRVGLSTAFGERRFLSSVGHISTLFIDHALLLVFLPQNACFRVFGPIMRHIPSRGMVCWRLLLKYKNKK